MIMMMNTLLQFNLKSRRRMLSQRLTLKLGRMILPNSDDDDEYEEFLAKDGNRWSPNSIPQAKIVNRNIIRQRRGEANFSILYTDKQIFKSLISPQVLGAK